MLLAESTRIYHHNEYMPQWVLLTRREWETVYWAVRGYHNKAIAEKMMIGPTTAERHLGNVYAKLGISELDSANARGALCWLALKDGFMDTYTDFEIHPNLFPANKYEQEISELRKELRTLKEELDLRDTEKTLASILGKINDRLS